MYTDKKDLPQNCGYYCTINRRLLDLVEKEVGANCLCGQAWADERKFSLHKIRAFCNGKIVQYIYLDVEPPGTDILEFLIEENGEAQGTAAFEEMARGCSATEALVAYLGWLMTNLQFLDEHRELFCGDGEVFLKEGLPARIGAIREPIISDWELKRETDAPFQRATDRLHQFCVKWRLSHLAAPFLPEPLPQQDLSIAAHTDVGQSYARQDGMRGIVIPETMPLPGGSDLRNLLGASSEGSAPEKSPHLLEWLQLISSHNSGKRKLERYSRLFKLQHYFRLLQRRYSEALKRKTVKLHFAFARYFGVTEEVIKADLQFIRKQLGRDWYEIEPRF